LYTPRVFNCALRFFNDITLIKKNNDIALSKIIQGKDLP
jgi:hypothetical protein